MKKFICCILAVALSFLSVSVAGAKQRSNIVICGDSRVVGLAQADGVSCSDSVSSYNSSKSVYYLAKVGMGYDWLCSNMGILQEKCNKNTKVYMVFGVNDLHNIEKYKNLYKSLSKKLSGAEIYVARVGAVNDGKASSYGYSVRQSMVDSFNTSLVKRHKGYTVKDFWWGSESSYTTDGIHYTYEEYERTLKELGV